MRLPNSYGSVVKLSGKRRRPFAVRTSAIKKFVNIFMGDDPAYSVQQKLDKYNFTYKKKKGYWTAHATNGALQFADEMAENGLTVKIEYRQEYTFHAYFEKKPDALLYLANLNSGIVMPEPRKNIKAPSFIDVYEMWAEYKKGLKSNMSDLTWKNYNSCIKYFEPIYDKPVNTIRSIDIQPLLNKQNDKSKGIIMRMKTILTKVQQYAKMQHYIDYDFTEFLVYEYNEEPKNLHRSLSDEDIDILWQHTDERFVKIILINIYTGMRPSELLEMRNENIFLNEKYMIGGKKTKAGINRTIPIADRIYPFVESIYDNTQQYFIHSRTGTAYQYSNYYRKFAEIMDEYNLPSFIPHDCRHTFATLMDRAGANEICTKLIMGHSLGKDMTKGVYTHKTLEDLLREVNKI
jgi:integrase